MKLGDYEDDKLMLEIRKTVADLNGFLAKAAERDIAVELTMRESKTLNDVKSVTLSVGTTWKQLDRPAIFVLK